MQLEEQFYESSAARWKRELPWLRIFRGFRIAMDFRKILLALAGALIYAAGMMAFARLPYSPHVAGKARPAASPAVGVLPVHDPIASSFPGSPSNPVRLTDPLYRPWNVGGTILNQVSDLLTPWRVVVEPAHGVMFARTLADFAWGWTALLWALAVWAVFGGAIARIAALELSGEGVPSLREAISHSGRFVLSTLGGVLLPVVGVAMFWLFPLVLGFVGQVPSIGPLLTGLFYFVSVIAGALLALILVGLAACWPLMYATIAVEGTDAFDALSRSYSYVFGRPWYGVWIAALALLYGAVVLLFLQGAMWFAHDLAWHATAAGMGEKSNELLWDTPPAVIPGVEPAQASIAGQLRAMWANGFLALSTVFVFSYFWVAVTIAYFLLRHAEDATPFKKVYWPAAEPVHDGPALSGMAAAEYRERQASATGEAAGQGGVPPAGGV